VPLFAPTVTGNTSFTAEKFVRLKMLAKSALSSTRIGAVGFETIRLTHAHIEAAKVWTDSCIASDIEQTIRTSACITVDINASSQRKRNAAADVDYSG
jgi:hypothetical protein